jgi:hypothetical protein
MAGHELRARRRAERLRITALEADSFFREPVEVGRFVRRASIGAETFVAEVVGENEDDIRAVASPRRLAANGQEEREEECPELGLSDHANEIS